MVMDYVLDFLLIFVYVKGEIRINRFNPLSYVFIGLCLIVGVIRGLVVGLVGLRRHRKAFKSQSIKADTL
jgi:hypothetical protein